MYVHVVDGDVGWNLAGMLAGIWLWVLVGIQLAANVDVTPTRLRLIVILS